MTTETLTKCSWSACPASGLTDVLIDRGDGEFWCLDHLTDDALPAMHEGKPGYCVRCGRYTRHRTDGGVELCDEEPCRRMWAMAQEARPARGAYARKMT